MSTLSVGPPLASKGLTSSTAFSRSQRSCPVQRVRASLRSSPPEACMQSERAPVQQGGRDIKSEFLQANGWARPALQIHTDVLHQIQQEFEPVHVQPTRYAANGVLQEPALDGQAQFTVETHAGEAISHLYQSTALSLTSGVMYSKTGVRACNMQGTPNLDIELAGTGKSMLIALFFMPRLATLRHTDYAHKYYMTVPPHAPPGQLLPFSALHKRMHDRAQAGQDVQTLLEGEDSTLELVYKHFHSIDIWTRMASGHGALFTYDPDNPRAVAAMREDVQAAVSLWCAWAKADWAGGSGAPLPGDLLAECREMSKTWSRHMDMDAAAKMIPRIYGAEADVRIRNSASGEASLAGAPWWMD